MAASYHTRSNSFPSTSTSVVSQFDEQLSRLSSSEFVSSSTSKLSLLSGLYDCVDEVLQLPSSQKIISSRGEEKSVEDALEGSIMFLDICSTITDVVVQMKERAQQLQSILRRRCSKNEITKEVAEYLKSRKSAIKAISRTLKDLKKFNNESSMENTLINKLRECQMATSSVLQSILLAIAGAKATTSSWDSVVSKLLKSKHAVSQQETEFFLVGFEASAAALHPEIVMSGLEEMAISLKNVEEGVEILFRHLIKTRTTVLNIINC